MNNILSLQTIIAFLAASMILRGMVKYIKREQGQTFFKVALTVFTWGNILAFSLFPSFSHAITRALDLGENLNTLIFFGFVIVFLVLTKIISIVESIERNVSEIVRKEALKNLDK